MSSKYIERAVATGRLTEVQAINLSTGATDADKIIRTDANGLIDPSLMPSGVAPDQQTANANGAVTAKDLVYMESAGTIARASATSATSTCMGWATSTVTTGNPVTMQLEGRIVGLTGLTTGARYYLSDSTPGGLTSTPVTGAGKIHQYIGTAMSTTVLNFEPDEPVVLV